MTNENLKDEKILAAIIAGGVASGREVRPATGLRCPGHDNGFGVHAKGDTGPCCAVGAGVLFAGLEEVDDCLVEFARIHDVSVSYAHGVSNGFESISYTPWFCDADYERGYAVGVAAWAVFGARGRIR